MEKREGKTEQKLKMALQHLKERESERKSLVESEKNLKNEV